MTLIKTVNTPDGGCENIEMTPDEEAAFLADQADMQASVSIATLKSQAQSALDKSDLTVLRCMEKGVAVPAAWATYRSSLRSVLVSGMGAIPTQPAYPAQT